MSSAREIGAVLEAVVETVRECPEGCPGGILYAGLMTLGCNLSTFEAMMAALVREGKLEKRGQVYFAVANASLTPQE